MEREVAVAIGLGVLSFTLLRGRMIQGDLAAASLLTVYLLLLVSYRLSHPEWLLLEVISHPVYLIVLSLTTLWACFVHYRISPLHPLYKFPGPVLNRMTELRLAYSALRLTRYDYVCELHKKYGPVVRIAPNSISINSKTAVYTIYRSPQCFNKTDSYDLHLNGEGLFFVKERERHAVRRKSWNQAFSSNAIKEYHVPLFQTTQALINRVAKDSEEGGLVDFVKCITHWAFDTSALITFGGNGQEMSLLASGDPLDIAEKPRTALLSFELFSHMPWLFHILKHFPSSTFRQFEDFSASQAKCRLDADKIQFRDVFSYWVEDADEVNLEELASESMVAMIAATETVSSIVSLAFFFVLANPRWHRAVCEELDNTFSSHTPLTTDSITKLEALPVLNATVQEVFRVGALFSGLTRIVPSGGAWIDGQFFPEGTTVSVPIYAQNTSESNFGPDPSAFDPGRWLSDTFKVDERAMLTFGVGPFGCVGRKLAYTQVRLVLACVFLALDISTEEGFDPTKFWKGVGNLRATVLKEPLKIVAHRRDTANLITFPAL